MTRSWLWREFESGDGAAVRMLRRTVVAVGGGFLCVAAFLPMGWAHQAVLALVVLAAALWAHCSSRSRLATLTVMLLSTFAAVRYAVWRVSSVASFLCGPGSTAAAMDTLCSLALLAAEGYAIAVLLLGYMQAAWPLRRMPAPLPDDPEQWPAVDVLIPTLDEPLELVRFTVLAAMNIDWPVEKLHVWLLDDGDRADFRGFAEGMGIGYLARKDNRGAKAGNINHALEHTSGPFVAVFDCDQAPTRSFLQMTMGWFLRDAKLALVQTPHRFYSPDPFERNLTGFGATPGEEQLFHGVIQDGNDLWNATGFCGSCAVLRRSALDEIGGVAMETVTEDVHTSLRLQKRGWGTAYIDVPQAAGLATERLSAYVRQRVRWARGMMQLLRIENPLVGGELSWQQRLCYFNEAAYFLCALPRLVFLAAPAAYLIFGWTAIPGAWPVIAAYALPYLLLGRLTHARIYGSKRYALWNEVYETVMAPHILLPTLAALVRPRWGRFDVTEKGGVVDHEFYDVRMAWPYLLLLLWNCIALLCAAVRLHAWHLPANAGWMNAVTVSMMRMPTGAGAGVIWINALWAMFNLAVLAIAAGAARESAQRRRSVRLTVAVPADVVLADGTIVPGVTCDLSHGGMRAITREAALARAGDRIEFILPLLDGAVTIPGKIVQAEGVEIRAEFGALGLREAEALTTLLYSRADAWLQSGMVQSPETMFRGLGRLIALSLRGVWRLVGGPAAKRRTAERSMLTDAAPVLLGLALLGGAARAAQPQPSGNGMPASQIREQASAAGVKTASQQPDLSVMTRQFSHTTTTIPIVFAAQPTAKEMQAAAIVASWLGVMNSQPARFVVSAGTIPAGDAIVLAVAPSPLLNALAIKAIPGPMAAARPNPSNPASGVLLLTGNDADELLTAAMGLALQGATWQGPQVVVRGLERPGPRAPDDAPRWLSTDRAATFAQAQISGTDGELQGDGSRPLTATLRLPPDLDYRGRDSLEQENLALHLDYRYDGVPLGEGSTLNVFVNGAYVSSTPMPHTDKASEVLETVVPVPVTDLRPLDNQFTFQFAFRARQSGPGGAPPNLMGAVLKDSYLDIRGIAHWTELPNLKLFARGGYPFTRRADLADTAVVLPDAPSARELEAFLAVMARFGAETGLPALNLTVTTASSVDSVEGKDLLVVGTPADQPVMQRMNAALPVEIGAGGLRMHGAEAMFGGLERTLLDRWRNWHGGASDEERFGEVEMAGELPDAIIEEIEWPRRSGRTAVVIALRDDAAAAGFTDALDGSAAGGLGESVSVLHGNEFSSYRLGSDAYRVGAISPWTRAEFALEESPWLVAILAAIVCFLFALLAQARLRRRARERLHVAAG